MREFVRYEDSICNEGNLFRVKRVMKKARSGEKITIGFIGGSITQGSLATSDHNCYAYKVFEWWKEKFKDTHFDYVNAGIGGTTSHFAVARVSSDLLKMSPDLVFVEFSVNDDDNNHFLETYEGLVRQIYKCESKPAIVLISNVYYDSGINAQLSHLKVARYYEFPLISMKSAIYPAVIDGKIAAKDITPDNLHPNDMGHELVASVVRYFLDRTLEEISIGEKTSFEQDGFPKPFTANTYENAVRLDSRNYHALCKDFVVDKSRQTYITDCFKNGWLSDTPKGRITFIAKCSGVAIQYRKYVSKGAPKAKVFVDGKAVAVLNANFDKTWGDKLELTTVFEHGKLEKHKIEVAIEECADVKNPFNLVSVILAE